MICEIPFRADSNPAKPETLCGFSLALAERLRTFHPGSFARFEARAKFFMSAKYYPGAKFINLTLVKEAPPIKSGSSFRPRWECLCDCGKTTQVRTNMIGRTMSCGCVKLEINRLQLKTHGLRNSKEYNSWHGIKGRCLNKNHPSWKNYGGRGVTMCQEWVGSFEAFYKCVGPKPSPKHSIDRIDNDGNYDPGNVRWATKGEQLNNTRRNRRLTFNGKTQTFRVWAIEIGMSEGTLRSRIEAGWTTADTLTIPTHPQQA